MWSVPKRKEYMNSKKYNFVLGPTIALNSGANYLSFSLLIYSFVEWAFYKGPHPLQLLFYI